MTGGTSLLKNLDKLVTKLTGVPCHVAEDALLCVARGTGVALENIELYKRSIAKRWIPKDLPQDKVNPIRNIRLLFNFRKWQKN